MSKNRFASTKIVRKEMTEGDWIDVKEALSWKEFSALKDRLGNDANAIFELFELVIKDWSFTDGENPVPLSIDNMKNLEVNTLNVISEIIMAMYMPKKKSSVTLLQESQETIEKPNAMNKS